MILHEKQQKLLKFIDSKPPGQRITRQEMMDELGFSSKSVVQHHLNQLVSKRYLKQSSNDPSIYFSYSTPRIPLVYLQMYGRAKCGPDGDILSGTVEDTIAIASHLIKGHNPEDAFLVIADGESMSPFIQHKDIVIGMRNRMAESGDIVIGALNGEAFIKRFRRISNEQILLESLNSSYSPLVVSQTDQLLLAGQYIGLIRV